MTNSKVNQLYCLTKNNCNENGHMDLMESMRGWMKEHCTAEKSMYSTGIYSIPIWWILRGHIDLKFINPYFIKQLQLKPCTSGYVNNQHSSSKR